MKAITSTLLLCTMALCELPPPLPQRGFRPSSQYPSTLYGPPTRQLSSLDLKIPSKLTIEQLIRLTEQLQSSRGRVVNVPQRIQVSLPQNSYLPPPREPQQSYGPPSKLQTGQLRPQVSYGPPQNQYQPPQSPNKWQSPQTQYVPPPQNVNLGSASQQAVPQTSYGVPNKQLSGTSGSQSRPPATSYGVPDLRNIETLGEQQQNDDSVLRQNLLSDLRNQQLPYKSPTGFRPQENAQAPIQPGVSQQYLPTSGGSNVGQPQVNVPQSSGGTIPSSNRPTTVGSVNNVGQNYLPPQTTPRSVFTSRATTLRPSSTVATTTPAADDASPNYDYDYDLRSATETPLNQEGSEAGPNISISNAVAGAGNFFYLQQPDGRLQKVVLQKTQEPNSKPEEYVANYYFQNIQSVPNAVYTPLISLGSYTQK